LRQWSKLGRPNNADALCAKPKQAKFRVLSCGQLSSLGFA